MMKSLNSARRELVNGSLMIHSFKIGSRGTRPFYGALETVYSIILSFRLMCVAGVGKTFLA